VNNEDADEMTNKTFSLDWLIYDPEGAYDPDACEDCGMGYEKHYAPDRQFHARVHDKAVNGVPVTLASYRTQIQVAQCEKVEIYYADESTTLNLEKKLAEAAQNANSETHYDFGVFHVGDIRGAGARVVWALDHTDHIRGRIVGLLVIDSRCRRAWNLSIDCLAAAIEGRSFSASETEAAVIRGGVAFGWVLRKHRRRGLASLLVRRGLSLIGAGMNEVAFQKPFTPAAARLILQLARGAGWEGVWIY
jgi:hypothetical protein